VRSKNKDGSGSSSIAGWVLESSLFHGYNMMELSIMASWHRRVVNTSHSLSICLFFCFRQRCKLYQWKNCLPANICPVDLVAATMLGISCDVTSSLHGSRGDRHVGWQTSLKETLVGVPIDSSWCALSNEMGCSIFVPVV